MYLWTNLSRKNFLSLKSFSRRHLPLHNGTLTGYKNANRKGDMGWYNYTNETKGVCVDAASHRSSKFLDFMLLCLRTVSILWVLCDNVVILIVSKLAGSILRWILLFAKIYSRTLLGNVTGKRKELPEGTLRSSFPSVEKIRICYTNVLLQDTSLFPEMYCKRAHLLTFYCSQPLTFF